MTLTQIILTVVTSSIAAAVLTSAVNWFIHQSNYKKDFYKKIIEKRMTAYEQVGQVVFDLGLITNLGSSVCHTFCFSKDHYQDFLFKLVGTKDSSFWIGDDLRSKITELNVFIHNEIDNNIDNSLNDNEINRAYQSLGTKHFERIRTYRKEIEALMEKDYKKLHKVKSFLKKKSPNNSTHGIDSRKYDRVD